MRIVQVYNTYTYRHGRQTRLQVVVVTRTYWRQQSFYDMYIILYIYICKMYIVYTIYIIHIYTQQL